MPMISGSTDARRRRYRVAISSTQIILEQVMLVECNDVVTLNARIMDTSNQPHTFFWEQISGTPVLWLEDQHQLMVMWRQPSDTNEKVFRFWLDRGTAFEKFQDVLVTPRNRDPFNLPVLGDQVLVKQNWSDAQVIADSSIAIMPAPRIDNPGGVVVNAPMRALSWTNPTNLQYADSIEVSTWKDGVETQIAVLRIGEPGGRQCYNGIQDNVFYRLTNITNQLGFITRMEGKYHFFSHVGTLELDTFEDVQVKLVIGDFLFTRDAIERSLVRFGLMPGYDIPSDTYGGQVGNDNVSHTFTTDVIDRSRIETPLSFDTYGGTLLLGDIAFTRTVAERNGVIPIG